MTREEKIKDLQWNITYYEQEIERYRFKIEGFQLMLKKLEEKVRPLPPA